MTSLGNITPTESAGFDPVPSGKYPAEIIDHSEPTEAKSGNGELIKVTWKIIYGDYVGRLIFQTINFHHSNPQTEEIAQKELGQIVFACGHSGENFDITDVHHIPCLITVRVDVDKSGQYEPQNRIRRIERMPIASGQGQSPQPTSGGAGNGNAPWR